MLEGLRSRIFLELFRRGFQKIEESDWMTQVLKLAIKKDIIKAVWQSFLNSVESMLLDAIEEVKKARMWKE